MNVSYLKTILPVENTKRERYRSNTTEQLCKTCSNPQGKSRTLLRFSNTVRSSRLVKDKTIETYTVITQSFQPLVDETRSGK